MMTSKEVAKCDAVENRRRSPLDHLPPPANSNKPLTPFSIEDILNKPSVKRSYTICGTAHLISSSEKHRPSSIPLSSRALLNQTSPLCALEELASKTFKGLEVSVLQAAEGFCVRVTEVALHLHDSMLADLEKCANGTLGHPRPDSPARGGQQELELAQKLRNSPLSPFSDHTTSKECSEDED
ncbi:hypothetical protein FQN60_012323, partial [Etheostoma spectabile]